MTECTDPKQLINWGQYAAQNEGYVMAEKHQLVTVWSSSAVQSKKELQHTRLLLRYLVRLRASCLLYI
jgi:hypothetical protein